MMMGPDTLHNVRLRRLKKLEKRKQKVGHVCLMKKGLTPVSLLRLQDSVTPYSICSFQVQGSGQRPSRSGPAGKQLRDMSGQTGNDVATMFAKAPFG